MTHPRLQDRSPGSVPMLARTGFATLILFGCLLAAGPVSAQAPTSTRMHALFDALTRVLPVSLSQAEFDAPRNRDRIRQSLDTIAANH